MALMLRARFVAKIQAEYLRCEPPTAYRKMQEHQQSSYEKMSLIRAYLLNPCHQCSIFYFLSKV
jgi:hypothetical protein